YILYLLFCCSVDLRHLHSFPTRRSSDLSLHDWDDAKMRDRCQQLVATRLSSQQTIGLIDDSSSPKRGSKTPGVQRQWCGHLGKVDRKSTRLNSSHLVISYAVFCLKKKNK